MKQAAFFVNFHIMLDKLTKVIQSAAEPETEAPELISYRTLRRAVGWLGVLIPVILIGGGYFFGDCKTIQPSISHYYYTNVRDLFVATLCGVSLFLFCYRGWSKMDSRCANLAGFFGILLVLFPTNVIGTAGDYYFCQQRIVSFTNVPYHNIIHLTSAALFFLTLAFISIFLFTKSNRAPSKRTDEKKIRNRIYQICGAIMIGCIVSIGIYFFVGKSEEENPTTLVLESIALLAFGISWLTKGQVIAGD